MTNDEKYKDDFFNDLLGQLDDKKGKKEKKMKEPVNAIKTHELEQFMKSRFQCDDRWHFFTELRLGTGYSNEQRADGFLMELWPSKGFVRTAFEYKVSRQDFLKEIKNPQKRQSIKSYSDHFVIITANDIVKDKSEIPSDCGWFVFDGKELKTMVRPPKLPPTPFADWPFICSLVRSAFKNGGIK